MNRYRLAMSVAMILLASRAIAQETQPATQPLEPLDLASVVFAWNQDAWKPKVAVTPLIVVGGRAPQMGQCYYDYIYALKGHSYPGSRHLLGYLGGPFPEGSALVPETFTRQGDQIRLSFRYDPAAAATAIRNGNVCFFGATLGDALPDGRYEVTVEVKGLPAGIDAPALQRLQFEKPDPRIRQAQTAMEDAKALSAQALFDQYRTHAETMTGVAAPYEVRPVGRTPLDYASEDARTLSMLRSEIVRRGKAIAPILIEALKEQAVRNPVLQRHEEPPRGLARELMEMLTEIGDARGAPVMIDILSGKLRCNALVTRTAREQIEKLTLVCFRRPDPSQMNLNGESILVPNAADDALASNDQAAVDRDVAMRYERWIADHPADQGDSTPWLRESIRLARTWLEGDDLNEACNAAAFLRLNAYRPRVVDDDPARTTRQIAQILGQCEIVGVDNSNSGYARYTYRHKPTGQTLPDTMHRWADLLTRTPSLDPQFAALLIRLDREMPEYPGAMARYLLKVGGHDAMAYRVEQYRKLLAEMNERGIDPKTDISTLRDNSLQPLIWNGQYFRWGIERWAGRTFATDEDLDLWWAADADKTQAQWLEAGLPITAAKADAGERQSQYLLRVMLDNALPNPPSYLVWMEPGYSADPSPRAEEGEPFRVKWLAEHSNRLRCDAVRGVFAVTATEP